ncbi:MAG: Gfo/Idh/MocA family oxidoreductase, partial [Gemmatimonadota bacterium]|nr:Gfo/Idh/MocA family oxidoreductase [Gemmatimonadota bacterium]
ILSRMEGVEVTLLHDSDAAKARTLAERFRVPRVARSADEVWRDDEVDGVVIATPSFLHEEHARAALAAGKYVLCEKPLALSAAGAARVLAEDGADGRLIVAMNQRFRPDARALRELLLAGALGEIFTLSAGWLSRSVSRDPRSWRQRKESAGGGAFMDLGVQMLDLALWLLEVPEPRRVSAQMHRAPGTDVEDAAALMVRLAGERWINLEVAWSFRPEQDRHFLHLMGEGGSASLDPLSVFRDTPAGPVDATPRVAPSRENPFTASYRQELEHFVETVRGERAAAAPTEQATLMRLVEGTYRSAEEGTEIDLG